MLWFGLALILGWLAFLLGKAFGATNPQKDSIFYKVSLLITALICIFATAISFVGGIRRAIEEQFWY